MLIINIIAYLIKTSQYASEEAKQMSDFYIPMLTLIGLSLGLIIGYFLTKSLTKITK
jgi:hypothetical protein